MSKVPKIPLLIINVKINKCLCFSNYPVGMYCAIICKKDIYCRTYSIKESEKVLWKKNGRDAGICVA